MREHLRKRFKEAGRFCVTTSRLDGFDQLAGFCDRVAVLANREVQRDSEEAAATHDSESEKHADALCEKHEQ